MDGLVFWCGLISSGFPSELFRHIRISHAKSTSYRACGIWPRSCCLSRWDLRSVPKGDDMRYRWLQLPVFGAFALTMALAGPVSAQEWPRAPYGDRGYDRGYSDRGYGDYGYDNGYRAGAREGARDAREGRAFGYK